MILAYALWGWVQMADAEAEAAPRPEMQRLVAALRNRLWQLQTELCEQEVSEASSRAYCRGFCQVRGAARSAGRSWGRGPGGSARFPRSCRGAARCPWRRALLLPGAVRGVSAGVPLLPGPSWAGGPGERRGWALAALWAWATRRALGRSLRVSELSRAAGPHGVFSL